MIKFKLYKYYVPLLINYEIPVCSTQLLNNFINFHSKKCLIKLGQVQNVLAYVFPLKQHINLIFRLKKGKLIASNFSTSLMPTRKNDKTLAMTLRRLLIKKVCVL